MARSRGCLPRGFPRLTTAESDSSTTKSESTPKVVISLSSARGIEGPCAGDRTSDRTCGRRSRRARTRARARDDSSKNGVFVRREIGFEHGPRVRSSDPGQRARAALGRLGAHARGNAHRTFSVVVNESSRGDLPRGAGPTAAFFGTAWGHCYREACHPSARAGLHLLLPCPAGVATPWAWHGSRCDVGSLRNDPRRRWSSAPRPVSSDAASSFRCLRGSSIAARRGLECAASCAGAPRRGLLRPRDRGDAGRRPPGRVAWRRQPGTGSGSTPVSAQLRS